MPVTMALVANEIDTLRAENAALRTELDALLDTQVGEVVAHNQELFAEVRQLRAQVARLEANQVSPAGVSDPPIPAPAGPTTP